MFERFTDRARKVIDKAPEEVKQLLRNGKTTISKEYQKIFIKRFDKTLDELLGGA